MIRNDLFLRAARRERTERTPVWLMRQAGRFDPRYRAIREEVGLPLEALFRHPELACRISLLPRRFGVDAIIFFQDILTPMSPMGAPFVFRPGPMLESPIRTAADLDRLTRYDPARELPFVAETLRRVRAELDGALPLLGFAGAPLTLAMFLIEGASPGAQAAHGTALMREDPRAMHRLLERLTDVTIDYLGLQIESGADAVQLFESCANVLTADEYRAFALPYHRRIFAALSGRVPTILFARDHADVEAMADSGADVISIGSGVDLANARRRVGDRVALQGNIDNHLLATGSTRQIERTVRACVQAGAHAGHVLNLGHGVLKDTPVENVECLIRTCTSMAAAPQRAAAAGGKE